MKKIFLYAMTLLLSAPVLNSCTDSDNGTTGEDPGREFMTMFRTDDTTGKGAYPNDPYACHADPEKVNTIKLYWYGVDDCAGYEVKMSIPAYVASGEPVDWENPEKILWHEIVGPDVLEATIEDLEYSNDYRFAIRTLSKKALPASGNLQDIDLNSPYHSKWFGYGAGRRWGEYCGVTTGERYEVPAVISQAAITKTSFRINLDPSYVEDEDQKNGYTKHFNTNDEKTRYKIDVLHVTAAADNPTATIDPKWANYKLTAEDIARGYVEIEGVDENSVYLVRIEDSTNPVAQVDRYYNDLSVRTDGEPGDPIFIEHNVANPELRILKYRNNTGEEYEQVNTELTPEEIAGAQKYDACRIDNIINNFINDQTLAEGQVFELEGGKAYYFATNVSLSKGFTLRTRPSDIEAGKGRAIVYMNGLYKNGSAPVTSNFMFGRQPKSGESPALVIYVKHLIFEDLEFDCPLAVQFNGATNGTGNYFINMYSNGMGVTLQSFEMRRCKVQRLIRGFIRVQGSRIKTFENVTIEDNEFFNCGFYDNNGRGYAWIAGDGSSAKSNIYKDMVIRNNTFFDSPRTCFFTDNGKDLNWNADIQYKITLENNTFVNFSTRSSGRQIFDLRYVPTGSQFICKKNLFILTKQSGDTRPLYQGGADIRQVNGNPIALNIDFADNYSTNTNLTGQGSAAQIFSANAFNASKNSFGNSSFEEFWKNGESSLAVIVDDISPEELMHQPNPPYKTTNENGTGQDVDSDADGVTTMHNATSIDGEGSNSANLYYRNTDKVKNSAIYRLGIGASKWREGIR